MLKLDKCNNLKAKEVFLKYSGNHFYMERGGEYENYKKYSISDIQEELWLNEYQNELLSKVENEDIATHSFSQLIDVLRRTKNMVFFQLLLDIVKRKEGNLDTFSQILMAEGILNIAESLKGNTETENVKMAFQARQLALSMLNSSIKKPVTVASYFSNLGYLKDVLTEDKILNRIKNIIRKWKK